MASSDKHAVIGKFIEAVEKKDQAAAAEVLRTCFSDPGWGQEDLATLCYAVFDRRLDFLFLAPFSLFCERFPDSLLPVQALYGSVLTQTQNYQLATEECRFYLRKLKKTGLLERLAEFPLLGTGASFAFLAMTSAYTELGWRSYSLRILSMGLQPSIAISDREKEKLQREREIVANELNEETNRELDSKWEAFYKTGAYSTELYQLCLNKEYTGFAERVDLLETSMRFGQYPLFEKEVFLTVFHMESKDSPATKCLA